MCVFRIFSVASCSYIHAVSLVLVTYYQITSFTNLGSIGSSYVCSTLFVMCRKLFFVIYFIFSFFFFKGMRFFLISFEFESSIQPVSEFFLMNKRRIPFYEQLTLPKSNYTVVFFNFQFFINSYSYVSSGLISDIFPSQICNLIISSDYCGILFFNVNVILHHLVVLRISWSISYSPA